MSVTLTRKNKTSIGSLWAGSQGWGGVEPDLLTSMAVGSEAKMEPHCVVWVGVTM